MSSNSSIDESDTSGIQEVSIDGGESSQSESIEELTKVGLGFFHAQPGNSRKSLIFCFREGLPRSSMPRKLR